MNIKIGNTVEVKVDEFTWKRVKISSIIEDRSFSFLNGVSKKGEKFWKEASLPYLSFKDNQARFIPINEKDLAELGFKFIQAPIHPQGTSVIDRFSGYDYAMLHMNGDQLVLRVNYDFSKVKLEGFYNSELKYMHEVENLIDLLKKK